MLTQRIRLLLVTVLVTPHFPLVSSVPKNIPYLVGYVRLSFQPTILSLTRGQEKQGQVNVSVNTDYTDIAQQTVLRACCVDKQVVTIMSSHAININPNQSIYLFNISVLAKNLGRTSIRFYLMRLRGNESHVTSHNTLSDTAAPQFVNATGLTQSIPRSRVNLANLDSLQLGDNNASHHGGIGWLTRQYAVIVYREPVAGGCYLYYIIMGMIVINLIGIGGQVDPEEVVYLVRRPLAITLAFFCRFGVMPALGLGLVELIQPTHSISLGILSLLCAPGEGASNLLLLLMEGDLTLSVTITIVNNFATVAMLPLWTIVFERRLYHAPGNVHIPFRHIFTIFGSMTAALTLGFFIHRRCSKFYAKLWLYLPALTVLALFAIPAVDLYNRSYILNLLSAKVFLLSLLIATAGYIFGAAVSFVGRQTLSTLLVITVDTGVRTGFIADLLVSRSLEPPDGDLAQATPTLCAFFCLVPCSIFVLVRRSILKYRSRLFDSGTEYTDVVSTIDFDDDTEADLLEEVEEVAGIVEQVLDSKETTI